MIWLIKIGGYMENKVPTSDYIHYYLITIIFSIIIWGVFEYISICNGMACMIDTNRLWKGLVVISSIFIPITLVLFPYILESLKGFPKAIREMVEDLQNPQIAPFGLILKLAIVFICVCMFVLFFYYAGLNSSAIKENSVAATQANMFVVAATLFAPLAALIFVQDWKTQHNKTLLSNEAKNLLKPLLLEQNLLLTLEIKINEQYEIENNRFTVTDNQLNRVFQAYSDITKKNNLDHAFFNFLVEKRTSDLYNKYLKQGGKLIDFHNKCNEDLKSYTSVKKDLKLLLDELKLDINKLTDELKSYILIK